MQKSLRTNPSRFPRIPKAQKGTGPFSAKHPKGRSGKRCLSPFLQKKSLRLEDLEKREMLTATPVISEFMALNTSTIQDEDSDFSDWIELGNTGDTQADLSLMYLTDDVGNLTKWQIPATTTLDAGSFLLIYASGKDKTIAGSELHTSFTLNELGGDLALVDTDGSTIVSQFSAFPALAANQSYGTVTPSETADYVLSGPAATDVDVLIPTDNSLGTTWTGAAAFDTSLWIQGTGSVGYDVASGSPTFDVNVYYSTVQITTLALSDAAIAGNNLQPGSPHFAQPTTVNYHDPNDTGGVGNFNADIPFPGDTAADDEDFVLHATTTFFLDNSQAGDWTFGFNSDDGGRVQVDGINVIVDDTLHGPEDRLGTINLAAGTHTLDYVFFERGGGAEAELFAAPGIQAAFNATLFDLVGDSNGVLPLGGLDDLVDTDIEPQMSTINPTAYIRYPFDVVDVAAVQSMELDLTYDDGYVLYLNGTQIDAVNQPVTLDNNSAALADSGLANKVIDLTPHVGLLRAGENILAVHGLNSSASDNDFLIQPSLSARINGAQVTQAFDLPTPGGLNGLIDPIVTEFQARNSNILNDVDGDSSDWIEIHNPGQVDMDLSGWHLTDDPLVLNKWTFPSQILPAGGYLVVFASDKDRAISGQELHTNFKLSSGGDYVGLVKPDGTTIRWEFEPGGANYPQQFQDVSYGLRGNDTSGSGEEGPIDPFASLVAYWDFEEGSGTTLTDSVGGFNGTLTNMDAGDWIAGEVGNFALDFDGFDNLVETGATAADLGIDGNNPRTVAGWTKARFLSNNGGVFSVGSGAGTFAYHSTGFFADLFSIDYNGTDINFNNSATADTWFHFAVTYNGSDAKLFFNGTEVSSRIGVDFNTSSTGTFRIGELAGVTINGAVDDLAIWNVALTSDIISELAAKTLSPGSRTLGVSSAGFEVRQVNASATFGGQVVGQVGGGADPLADVDALLALPGGDPGIDSEFTFDFNTINFFDNAGGGSNGLFTSDEAFPLDDLATNEDDFVVHATATLVVPAGSAGDFIIGFNSDEGGRLMIDGLPVITDNTLHTPTTNSTLVNLTEGDHTLDFVFFERTGGAEVELLYASATGGVADSAFRLIDLAPSQQLPPSNTTILDASRVFFDVPTPGAENNQGVESFVGPTTFSIPAGYYDLSFPLTILNETPGVDIYFTTNGTDPSQTNGTLYGGPINIASTTVVRAKAFLTDAAPSKTATASYFFVSDIVTQDATSAAAVGIPNNWGANTVQLGLNPNIINDPTWGPQMESALKQIPAISIVMNGDDLFGAQGIYSNAGNRGIAWERASSLELIDPNGLEDGFQVNAGLRIRGGFSRSAANPKHSFRVFFRSQYGDSKLNYDLFGDEGTDSFDSFDLRTSQNYSWGFGGDSGQNTFLRDVLSRDFQLGLGQQSTRSRYYNLYINGQYWGLYQTEERPEADFAESYFGGDEEDYDVVKNDPRAIGATDGNLDAYQRLWDFFVSNNGEDLSTSVDYFRAQGMNPDGTRNPAFERLLDVDSLIDYMIITYYTSDADGPGSEFTRPQLNNFFAIYNRENPDGFKFFEHDSEHAFDTGGAAGANFNMVSPFVKDVAGKSNFSNFGAHFMHEVLATSNTDYLQRFKDRVQEVFVDPNGIFNTANVLAMLDGRATQFDLAIIGESARWGEGNTSKTTWENAVTNMRNWIINGSSASAVSGDRVEEVLQQFRDVGWWTDFDPPVFDPTSGFITDPLTEKISLSVPGTTTFIETTLWDNSLVRSLIPPDSTLDATWTDPTFVPGAEWGVSNLGIGYDENTEYLPFIDTTIPTGTTSVYIRNIFPFSADSDNNGITDTFEEVILRVQYDDGFIAYLNGVEIASSNAPTVPAFDSVATQLHDDTAAVLFENFVIDLDSLPANTLMPQNNIIAIHALNVSNVSTDFLIDANLIGRVVDQVSASNAQIFYTTDGSDPRASGGLPSASAISYNTTADYIGDGTLGSFLVPDAIVNGQIGSTWTSNTFVEGAATETWSAAINGIGFDTQGVEVVSGFEVQLLDVTGDIDSAQEMVDLLNGITTGFAIVADTTKLQAYVNHGDAGNFATPAVLPVFNTDREQYAIRAEADVVIPAGTYTMAIGSDDGFRLTIPGVNFTTTTNQDLATGSNDSFQYSAPRGHGQTLGTFTIGSELTTTIRLDFYERDGGDSVELSIASGLQTSHNTTTFSILQDGTLSWSVKSPGTTIDFDPLINTDIETEAFGVNSSVYYRIPFTALTVEDLISLNMTMQYDDGFIAYINGVEVARQNAPGGAPTFNTAAIDSRFDAESITTEFFDLSSAIPNLVNGTNVLAIQLLNSDASNPDLLGIPTLSGVFGGTPFSITQNGPVKARSFSNGQWSSLTEEFYIIGSADVVVTEINYNPAAPTPAEITAGFLDKDDFEFVEITNVGTDVVNLSGIQFTEGIQFDYTTSTTVTSLNPGERTLIVRNQAAFVERYGPGLSIAGVYSMGLNNNADTLTLVDGLGGTIQSFTYQDNWYPITDNGGFSLVVRDENADPLNWSQKSNWRPSNELLGSPGLDDAFTVPAPGDLEINEILANTVDAAGTRVEIHNTTGAPLDISNWYLTDDELLPKKYQLPSLPSIPAGGFLTLDETTHFGGAFSLSSAGGTLILQAGGLSGELLGFAEEQDYGGSDAEVAFGRHINSSGDIDFVSMQSNTFDAANSQPTVGPIVINEIHYHPSLGEHEFLELTNVSGSAVDLTGWSFTDGIDFIFPSISLAPGEFLVVAAVDAATFTASNPVPLGVTVLGPYIGALNNDGERLELSKPGPGISTILVDGIRFNDNVPWPSLPDGTGPSLSKLTPNTYGNEPTNWGVGSANGTPGETNAFLDISPPSTPTNLNSAVFVNGNIALAWSPSTDAESGIDFYRIYRNGSLIATSTIAYYEDNFNFTNTAPVIYEVSAVNGDGIESPLSNTTQVTAQSISLKNGVAPDASYSGTDDATIRQGTPTVNEGATGTLEVDGDDAGFQNAFLIRWDVSPIANTAIVLGASVSLNVIDTTNGSYPLYPVLKNWVESEVTWNEFSTGNAWITPGGDDTVSGTPDRSATSVASLTFGSLGLNTADLTAQGVTLVQQWVSGTTTNNGFIATDTVNTEGLDVNSSDFITASSRPAMTVLFVEATDITPGDANLDGNVDNLDLQILLSHYGRTTNTSWGTADFNNDGKVSLSDLLIVKKNFGASSAPEPAAAAAALTVTVSAETTTKSEAEQPGNFVQQATKKTETEQRVERRAAGRRTIATDAVLEQGSTRHLTSAATARILRVHRGHRHQATQDSPFRKIGE